MMWFLTCVAALIGGYFIYGAFVEKIFGINEKRQTPAHTKSDGVDFVPMSTKKVYLVQLLNIAGVGPIFGPITGTIRSCGDALDCSRLYFCWCSTRLLLRHAFSA